MSIKDTSLMAYINLQDKGDLGKQEELIYSILKDNPNITNKEISILSGIEINAVSGRMNGLVKKNRTIDNGKKRCSITGRLVYRWMVV